MDVNAEIKNLRLVKTPTMTKLMKERKGLLNFKLRQKFGTTRASELTFWIKMLSQSGESTRMWR